MVVEFPGQGNELIQLTDEQLYDRMSIFRTDWVQTPTKYTFEQIKTSKLGVEVRRRAKADLFFLAKYFIGFEGKKNDKITERTHRRVCELFVKKDCSKSIGDQDHRKERMLLYPRGSLKSFLDVIDAIQWILNFPNIRILILSGVQSLATEFLETLKQRFARAQEGELPSFMNLFFEEFCIDPSQWANQFEFTTPQRTNKDLAQPTVYATSNESTVTGKHFDVLKCDDLVHADNSGSEVALNRCWRNYNINRKTRMLYGYLDLIGTRYDDMDAYGRVLQANIGDIVHESGTCWDYYENKTTGLLILIGRAWELKKEALEKTPESLGPDDYELLFPELLGYRELKYEQGLNEVEFEGQYLLNPRPKTHITFERSLLLKKTKPVQELPHFGPVTITWDFAFSKKKGRDFSTASVIIHDDKNRMYVVDLVRDRFKPLQLAQAVVMLAKKWAPVIIGIENAGASQMLEPTILSEAKKHGPEVLAICQRIDWFSVDTNLDAKKSRMRALHPYIVQDELFFSAALPHLNTLYDEFEKCLNAVSGHDDIPDVISQQPRYRPRVQVMVEKNEIPIMGTDTAKYNLIFEEGADPFGRLGHYVPPVTPPTAEEQSDMQAEVPISGLDTMLGSGLCG
jgi:hypothetical protein